MEIIKNKDMIYQNEIKIAKINQDQSIFIDNKTNYEGNIFTQKVDNKEIIYRASSNTILIIIIINLIINLISKVKPLIDRGPTRE